MLAAGGIGRSVVVDAGQGQSRGLLGAVVGCAEGAARTGRDGDCRPTLSVTVLPVCKIDRRGRAGADGCSRGRDRRRATGRRRGAGAAYARLARRGARGDVCSEQGPSGSERGIVVVGGRGDGEARGQGIVCGAERAAWLGGGGGRRGGEGESRSEGRLGRAVASERGLQWPLVVVGVAVDGHSPVAREEGGCYVWAGPSVSRLRMAVGGGEGRLLGRVVLC
jgi:hypothetical protein